MEKIYIRHDPNKKFKSVKELITYGYTGPVYGNGYKDTYCFVTTYRDIAGTIRQCHAARRSFDDLLAIAKTYFPSTTKRKMAKVLSQLHREISLVPMYCWTIHNPVFLMLEDYNLKPFSHYIDAQDMYTERYTRVQSPEYTGFNDILKLMPDEQYKLDLTPAKPIVGNGESAIS